MLPTCQVPKPKIGYNWPLLKVIILTNLDAILVNPVKCKKIIIKNTKMTKTSINNSRFKRYYKRSNIPERNVHNILLLRMYNLVTEIIQN